MRANIVSSLRVVVFGHPRSICQRVAGSLFSAVGSTRASGNVRGVYPGILRSLGQPQHRSFVSVTENAKEEPVETKEESQAKEHEEQEQPNPEEEAEAEEQNVDLTKKVADLEGRLEEASEKLKEMQLKYRLCLDNLEQMEKISAKKLENANLYAITKFSKDMLDVADTFELALKTLDANGTGTVNKEFVEGIKLTETQLHNTFEKYGIKRFESLKQRFNPEIHEAMFEIPNDQVDKSTVLQVVLNGYMIHDRVLRPAKVGVSRK